LAKGRISLARIPKEEEVKKFDLKKKRKKEMKNLLKEKLREKKLVQRKKK